MADSRKYFDKNALEAQFAKIGSLLQTPVVVYLLGGGAMCFRGQKPGTKDLDLVFRTHKEFQAFSDALEKSGFVESGKLEKAYAAMHASGIWQDKEEFRYDLFVNIVCNALSLSDGMLKRSTPLAKYGNFDVRLVSDEDVILFKGITERDKDEDDIAAIVLRGNVDWDIIMEECINQSKNRFYYGLLHNKFVALEQRYNISVPIADRLLALDDKSVIREAFEALLKKGLTPKQAKASLIEKEFTDSEIEDALKSD